MSLAKFPPVVIQRIQTSDFVSFDVQMAIIHQVVVRLYHGAST